MIKILVSDDPLNSDRYDIISNIQNEEVNRPYFLLNFGKKWYLSERLHNWFISQDIQCELPADL